MSVLALVDALHRCYLLVINTCMYPRVFLAKERAREREREREHAQQRRHMTLMYWASGITFGADNAGESAGGMTRLGMGSKDIMDRSDISKTGDTHTHTHTHI